MNAPLLPIFAGKRRHVLQFDAVPTFDPFRGDTADLVRWIEAKDPKAIGSWRELGNEEYARAFTAAQTAGMNVIDDLYFAFVDTLEAGGTERDYAAAVIPTLRRKGWLKGDDGAIASRVYLIWDTNLRVARGAGQWDRVQASKAGLPYLRGVTARDERVRHPPKSPHSDHRAWDGICLPVDHPFWTRWWTPLGFRCRCSIIQMTRSQFARWGGGITSDAELAEREARLGVPLFAAPGAGVYQQVADMAQAENSDPNRMPGLPYVDLGERRKAASAAWGALVQSISIDVLLSRLFG